MAHIEDSGGGRSKNLEVNLVPFIDLMSVLITFLLISAVWTQVSMIQIGSSIYGKKQEATTPAPPPPSADIVLKLEIRPNGYLLNLGKETINLPMKKGDYDEDSLLSQLKKFKEKYPTKTDAAIAMSDELPYERMIRGMDTMLKSGFPMISILTGGPD